MVLVFIGSTVRVSGSSNDEELSESFATAFATSRFYMMWCCTRRLLRMHNKPRHEVLLDRKTNSSLGLGLGMRTIIRHH